MRSSIAEARLDESWPSSHKPTAAPADDMLYGADQIATFLYGGPEHRRKVYYLVEEGRLPVVRMSGICARKSRLLAWFSEQEELALKPRPLGLETL